MLHAAKGEPQTTNEHIIYNSLLDSFLFRCRILLDFFYSTPERARANDCIAEDFAGNGPPWSAVRPPLPEALQGLKEGIGKRTVHLTYARVERTPERREWPILAIAQELANLSMDFTRWVPADHVDKLLYLKSGLAGRV